ncbi:N-formylglutamate amidohydrolase [Sphingobium sp.]|uniref:N-formylglutamate amidohydrolase n=1 Tax=Sphingobium sp. TaxID=1912891 RepID=UPI002CFDBFDC|nr:N-formylglutamate amidohydrolase [Sphingobium sp.]HUD91107.1 N-formylglutamate amidohydrolase [Sphingobium sp.]
MAGEAANLLGPDDPAPFVIDNAEGRSPFLLIGDHAGSAIPATLGNLGLSEIDRTRHIAVDIGVRGLGRALAHLLDAPFIHQPYSRLVIDCNRDPTRGDAVPAVSDGSRIAGNEDLNDEAHEARLRYIHSPYHQVISAEINRRLADGRATILLALHSFTPVLDGYSRPWDVGILHWLGQTDFARTMLRLFEEDITPCVGNNLPYRMDATDYTIPFHAFPIHLPYAELEVRQDLISDRAGQNRWAAQIQKVAETAHALLYSAGEKSS